METCRLKNIAILILLLLNAVLLLLLGHQHLQARHSAREADRVLVAELTAELPGELRDVVHRQGQPAAVEASGTVTAVQQVQGVPVAGCGVTLRFDRGVLTAVSGAHVSLEDASPEAGGRMSCITALVRFLDHRAAAGIVCSEVTGVSCVYELQGGGAP